MHRVDEPEEFCSAAPIRHRENKRPSWTFIFYERTATGSFRSRIKPSRLSGVDLGHHYRFTIGLIGTELTRSGELRSRYRRFRLSQGTTGAVDFTLTENNNLSLGLQDPRIAHSPGRFRVIQFPVPLPALSERLRFG
ncbi:hypothetical protein KM043_006322 [Ampulex compressa]|nr:hypothetical protein KM043_006322 [Ampulex compressa]